MGVRVPSPHQLHSMTGKKLFEGEFQVLTDLISYYALQVQRNQYMLIGGKIGIKLMTSNGWVVGVDPWSGTEYTLL